MEKKNLNFVFLIPILFLILAPLIKFPYGFYTLLRLIIFVCSGLIIYLSYIGTKTINLTVVVFGLVLLIYNPIIPVHLDRDLWLPINFLTAAIFGYGYYKIKKDN